MSVQPWATDDGRKAYALLDQVNGRRLEPAAALTRLAALANRAETTRGLHEVQDVAKVVRRLRGTDG